MNSQRKRNFQIQVSGGPNLYFNNVEILGDYIQPINYSLYTKWMWNTRYKLSFGLETGLVQMYRMADIPYQPNASSSVQYIPIHAAIHMRFKDNFYIAGTFGPSFIRNQIVSKNSETMTHNFSTADVTIAIGYKKLFQNNIFFGAEIKHFYSSKYEDRNISIPITLGLNF